MDDRDRKIIELLQEDGRVTNASIARKVNVSEGTVRRRLNRLVEEGYIRVAALTEPSKMGLNTEALIGIKVEAGKGDAVTGALVDMKELTWVASATGAYDIFAWAAVPDSEALGGFLRNTVGAIPGVSRTDTFVSLVLHKRW